MFVAKPSSKLSIVNVEIAIQVWGGGYSLRCFLNFKFTWIDEFQVLCNFFFLFLENYIVYISVGEIELLRKVFLACFEETLYKLRLIEYKNKSASNGAQLVPIGLPIVCWNIRPPNSTKILSIRYSSIFMTSASEYFCGASEWFRTKYVSL